jgi:hypothetical protein
MATSSIFTNVRIEDSSKAEVFINALEKAAKNVSRSVKQNVKLPDGTKKIYDSFIKSTKK